jgi:hypothetical protein
MKKAATKVNHATSVSRAKYMITLRPYLNGACYHMGEQLTGNYPSGYVDGHDWDGQGEPPVSAEMLYGGLREMHQAIANHQSGIEQQPETPEA